MSTSPKKQRAFIEDKVKVLQEIESRQPKYDVPRNTIFTRLFSANRKWIIDELSSGTISLKLTKCGKAECNRGAVVE